MKKSFYFIKMVVSILSVLLLITACGGGAETAKTPDPAAVTAAVMEAIEFPSPVSKSKEDIGVYYTLLDTASVESMSVYVCGSGAYPDEIAVFKFTDEAAAEAGFKSAEERLEELTETYSDYTPEEMYKLDDPVLEQRGDYVIFIDCSDNMTAAEIIDNQF
jgi:hypothetical protein